METVKPVAVYCRVSTEDQEREGTSLDTQRRYCLEYCKEHGYQVSHQFLETGSGLTLERPKLDDLRWLIRNQDIAGVIVYCLDRLSRDPTHGVILQEELEKNGVILEAVTETVESTDLGKLINYIRGYAAKLEAEKIRERTMRGTKARVLDKKLPVTYRQPFGYLWDRSGDKPKLVPNGDYNTLRLIFEMAMDGKSYDYIIFSLKKRGVLSPTGLPDWNKHTISNIIKNPVYAGQFYAFKSEVTTPKKRNGTRSGKTSVKRLPQDQWHYIPEIEVVNPPMTLEQRALLLAQLQVRQKLSSRNSKRDYLLRGMILCETHRGKGGKPRVYHGVPKHDTYYYKCPVGGCVLPFIEGEWADDTARVVIQHLLLLPLDSFFQSLTDIEKQRDFDGEIKKLEDNYEKVVSKIARLEDDRYEGRVDVETYQRLKAEYATRRQGIKTAQNKVLDEKSAMESKREALVGWEDLRNKFENRLLANPALTKAHMQDMAQKLFRTSKNDDEIQGLVEEAFSDLEAAQPLSNSEWRELLLACKFQWTILSEDNKQAVRFKGKQRHARILRRSSFFIDLPIASQKVIKDIALHCPEAGLHNQQYYPLRFSLSDFNIIPEAVASE